MVLIRGAENAVGLLQKLGGLTILKKLGNKVKIGSIEIANEIEKLNEIGDKKIHIKNFSII